MTRRSLNRLGSESWRRKVGGLVLLAATCLGRPADAAEGDETDAANRLHLGINKIEDGQVEVYWEGEGALQSAPSVSGPWKDLDSKSPFRVESPRGQRYFRVGGNQRFPGSRLHLDRALNSHMRFTAEGVRSPRSFAIADFNNDGDQDVVATDNSSADEIALTVLMGNGDGTFGSPKDVKIGAPTANAVTAEDFDGDGWADVAIVDQANGRLKLLFGDAGSLFHEIKHIDIGPDYDVVSGDFNGDGFPDLATGDDTDIFVLLNDGKGNFPSTETSPHGISNAFALTTEDFDGDGRLDVAVVDAGFSGSLSVMSGDGNGGLGSPTKVAIDFSGKDAPWDVVAGDFNGDGAPDLATANESQDSIAVVLNDGQGGFSSPRELAVGEEPASIVTGDFEKDGNLDLATANTGSKDVSILRGDGQGGFSRGRDLILNDRYGEDEVTSAAALGDFTGNGFPDLVVGNEADGTTYASVLPNKSGENLPLIRFDLEWNTQYGTSEGDDARDIAAMPDGGVVVLSHQNRDPTVRRFDASGAHLWSQPVTSGHRYDEAKGIAVSSEGQIYVLTGTWERRFGDLRNHYSALKGSSDPRGGIWDLLLFRLESDGTQQWVQQFGSSGHDKAGDLDVAPDGKIYVGGSAANAFTAAQKTFFGDLLGFRDGMVGCFTPGGIMEWNRLLVDGDENVQGIAYNEVKQTVVITGTTDERRLDAVGGGDWVESPDHAGNGGVFIAEFDDQGDFQMSRHFGVTDRDESTAVVADSQGNIAVAGETRGRMLSTGVVPNTGGPYLTQYASAGSREFIRQDIARNGTGGATDAATGPDDLIFCSGEDFKSTDPFVSVYDWHGNLLRNETRVFFDDTSDESATAGIRAIDVADDGTVYVTGNARGDVAGDANGSTDIWVARLTVTAF